MTTQLAPTWTIDASHSHAQFTVRHLMISNVKGEFQKLSGTVLYDPARPESLVIQASIDVASLNTREPKRDDHLRSADFFDVASFPTIEFASKQTTRKGSDLQVVGDLTIRGTTREVTLLVEDITPEQKDPWGNTRIGASASTKIKRSDFGMTWNAVIEAGGVMVGDEVKIHLDVELVKQA
ncbi:MAG: YceI family protein [Kofleriaceae bacterium]